MSNVVSLKRSEAAPDDLQTFAVEEDRKRLTGAAAKAVVRLVDAWGGSNAEGAALLGVSESTWDRIKSGRWEGVLSQDQLTRASALIGVFKGLHLLFALHLDIAARKPGEEAVEGGNFAALELQRAR